MLHATDSSTQFLPSFRTLFCCFCFLNFFFQPLFIHVCIFYSIRKAIIFSDFSISCLKFFFCSFSTENLSKKFIGLLNRCNFFYLWYVFVYCLILLKIRWFSEKISSNCIIEFFPFKIALDCRILYFYQKHFY